MVVGDGGRGGVDGGRVAEGPAPEVTRVTT